MSTYKATFCKRLKEIRTQRGISQRSLGILAGIDEFVASTRINRYEKGIHEVDFNTAGKLAETLDVPLAYFFAVDDQLASLILAFHQGKSNGSTEPKLDDNET